MDFGALVKERRRAMGLSQDQLAAAAGIDKPRISKAECGHAVYFGDDALKDLGRVLEVDPDLLALKSGKVLPEWRVLAARNAEVALGFFRSLEDAEHGQILVAVPEPCVPLVQAIVEPTPAAIAAVERWVEQWHKQRRVEAVQDYDPSEVPL